MQFSIAKATEILERTPKVLINLLDGISSDWTLNNEGENTWSPFDVVGHLIQGEKENWIQRAEIILSQAAERKFVPFDRLAQFEISKGKDLHQLLLEFEELRTLNISKLQKLNITDKDLSKTGIHPGFGEVTLSQLLSTWVVHDLDHISQIARVMAKQYKEEVGPWKEFLKVLRT